MPEPTELAAAFTEGYARGRTDGERLAVAVLKMYLEAYPEGGAFEPGDPLVSEALAVEIRKCVAMFGSEQHKRGRQHERRLAKARVEVATGVQ